MLTECVEQLKNQGWVRALNGFFRSGYYVALVTFLMVLSEVFALEIAVYYIYVVFAVLSVLFAEDALPLAAPIACCYMTFAAKNNPKYCPTTSIFATPAGYAQLWVCIALGAGALLSRLGYSLAKKPARSVPKLTTGFVALGIFYILGGLGSPFYRWETAFFGFIQVASVCAFYFYFYYTVNWEHVKKDYLPALFLAVGVGIFFEVAAMYLNPGVFEANGVNRWALYTGWGSYNPVGCVLAMCMPMSFYFAAKSKCGWAYFTLGNILAVGVVLTQSRGSILFGAIVYALCIILTLVKSEKRNLIGNLLAFAVFCIVVIIALSSFREELEKLFRSLLEEGMDPNGREPLFRHGWEGFKKYPFLGVGWGGMREMENGFSMFRVHNTVLQVLMTGGIALGAVYLFHRVQTAILLFRRPTLEKSYVALSILILLLTGMVDCHFYSFGPGILYSILLVFSECVKEK